MSLAYPIFLLLLLPLLYTLKRRSRPTLLWTSIALIILALSNPTIPFQTHTDQPRSHYIITLDLSYSMRADDLAPDRFTYAKALIRQILDRNPHTSFALFGFTTHPLILSPATSDHRLIQSAMESIEIDNILSKGTDLLTLLKRIGTLPDKEKSLLIFSDGGEDWDPVQLARFAKAHAITINAIGTATRKGALLHDRYKQPLRDASGHLILSRLNPNLRTLALQTGGFYAHYDQVDLTLPNNSAKGSKTHTQLRQTPLFWIPLSLASILFLLHFIRLPKRLLLLLPFVAGSADAGILDWYYLSKAQSAYEDRRFQESAKYYEALTHKSLSLELNRALSYYRAKSYKVALQIYRNLTAKDPTMKQKILWMQGNCEAKLKSYEKAKEDYVKALALGYNPDIVHNLKLILAKHANHRDMPASKTSEEADKKAKSAHKDTQNPHQKESKKKRASARSSSQAQEGAKGSSNRHSKKSGSAKAGTFSHPLGYKAYDTINKGYIDETKPW